MFLVGGHVHVFDECGCNGLIGGFDGLEVR